MSPAVSELAQHPELWNAIDRRKKAEGTPHGAVDDIWLRFRDMDQYRRQYGDDWSHAVDEHESVWQPAAAYLPAAKDLAIDIHTISSLPILGGILITRLAPGGVIAPHIDHGWHAAAHRKFYVALQNGPGSIFSWEDGCFEAKTGDVFEFNNDRLHWIVNGSSIPRLSMIVCAR